MKIVITPVVSEEISLSTGATFWPWESKIIKTTAKNHFDNRMNIPIVGYPYNYPYNGCCKDDQHLSHQERIELADFMISRWTKFKEPY